MNTEEKNQEIQRLLDRVRQFTPNIYLLDGDGRQRNAELPVAILLYETLTQSHNQLIEEICEDIISIDDALHDIQATTNLGYARLIEARRRLRAARSKYLQKKEQE